MLLAVRLPATLPFNTTLRDSGEERLARRALFVCRDDGPHCAKTNKDENIAVTAAARESRAGR
jgi:hypothetical protein